MKQGQQAIRKADSRKFAILRGVRKSKSYEEYNMDRT